MHGSPTFLEWLVVALGLPALAPGGGEGVNLPPPEGVALAPHPLPTLLPAVDGLDSKLLPVPLSSRPESSRKDGALVVFAAGADPGFALGISGSTFTLPLSIALGASQPKVGFSTAGINSSP